MFASQDSGVLGFGCGTFGSVSGTSNAPFSAGNEKVLKKPAFVLVGGAIGEGNAFLRLEVVELEV